MYIVTLIYSPNWPTGHAPCIAHAYLYIIIIIIIRLLADWPLANNVKGRVLGCVFALPNDEDACACAGGYQWAFDFRFTRSMASHTVEYMEVVVGEHIIPFMRPRPESLRRHWAHVKYTRFVMHIKYTSQFA